MLKGFSAGAWSVAMTYLSRGTGGRLREMALPTIDLDVLHFALVLALTIEFVDSSYYHSLVWRFALHPTYDDSIL